LVIVISCYQYAPNQFVLNPPKYEETIKNKIKFINSH
jgi:hypothetical protein